MTHPIPHFKKKAVFMAIFAFIAGYAGGAKAANYYYYFQDIPGSIYAPDYKPFNKNSTIQYDVSLDIDSNVIFKPGSTSETINFTLTGNENVDVTTDSISITTEIENTNVISSVSYTLTDGDGTLTVNRESDGYIGNSDITFSVVVSGAADASKVINAKVLSASNCSDAGSPNISTTNETDPTGVGHTIYCDDEGNYLITSTEDLLHISRNQFNSAVKSAIISGDYKLTNNVSFGSPASVDWDGDGTADGSETEGWVPLGRFTDIRFTGVWDGDGHSISNIYSKRSKGFQGLFGFKQGIVKNTQLINLEVNNTATVASQGNGSTAGLVGQLSDGTISKCSVSGKVTGLQSVGCLIGYGYNIHIEESFADCDVTNRSNNTGGLAGGTYGSSSISNSYAKGSVYGGITGTTGTGYSVGGIVGVASGTTVENCYFSGSVHGRLEVGSIAGGGNEDTMQNIYSHGTVSGDIRDYGGVLGIGQPGNAGDKCEYTSGNANCVDSDSIYIRAHGLWDDSVWENLGESEPKLEWEVYGDIKSEIDLPPLASCSSWDPFENMITYGDDYYLIGGADGESDVAKQQLLCLSNMQTPQVLVAKYRLMADVSFDVDETSVDWDGDGNPDGAGTSGWLPFGNANYKFTGAFDGNGKTISNLYINRPTEDYQGLFGYVLGDVNNLSIDNAYVSGKSFVGALAGRTTKKVENSSMSGIINGTSTRVAGLIGYAENTVSNSSANVDLTTTGGSAGGLVGEAIASIENSSAAGNVTSTGTSADYIAGLVGKTNSSISDSSSSVDVSALHNYIGGITGGESTLVSNSYNTGNITGGSETTYVGGISGNNTSGNTISNSYSTGAIEGKIYVGGLVGYDQGTISSCYATGDVHSFGDMAGGIVGGLGPNGLVNDSFYNGNSVSSDTAAAGGAIGWIFGGEIENIYANTTSVTAPDSAGGVIGSITSSESGPYSGTTISNSYATFTTVSATTNAGSLGGGWYDISSSSEDWTTITNQDVCDGVGDTPTSCSSANISTIQGTWSSSIWNLTGDHPTLKNMP